MTAMHGASESALLSLWEGGQTRHPIDRALLLCAWARPELAPEQLARLPLGTVNAALLQLRGALFGPTIDLQIACEQCGEQLETQIITSDLLAGARTNDAPATIDVQGFAFRLPDSRDLAAVSQEPDVDIAAQQLLERCCMSAPGRPKGEYRSAQHEGTPMSTPGRPKGEYRSAQHEATPVSTPGRPKGEYRSAQHEATPVSRPDGTADLRSLLAQVEEQLESADPLADMRLDVTCHACGHHTAAVLDPCTVLWTDVQRHARSLIEQVHTLARAYGWTESEVLALSVARRSAYLELATD